MLKHSYFKCNCWYLFQEVYNIDEISEAYAASVINTSHSVIQEGNFSSALVIHTKDIPYEEYRCEFVLKDYSICAKTIRLDNTGEFPLWNFLKCSSFRLKWKEVKYIFCKH